MRKSTILNLGRILYAAQLKKSVTIRFDQDVIVYFKALFEETGIPIRA